MSQLQNIDEQVVRMSRLNHLIDVLENVIEAKKNFYIGTWLLNEECGTVACAVGWGALDPDFKKEGLKLENIGEGVNLVPAYYEDFQRYEGYRAVAQFFKIGRREAELLFDPYDYTDSSRYYVYNYVTPEHVIARIQILMGLYEEGRGALQSDYPDCNFGELLFDSNGNLLVDEFAMPLALSSYSRSRYNTAAVIA